MSLKTLVDARGTDVSHNVEALINQSLMQIGDLNEQSFNRIQPILEMMMVWIKYLTNGMFILLKEQTLVKIQCRVPHIRLGLLVKTLQWLA
jgi:hypothetical protein